MTKPLRVLVCGGRDYNDRNRVYRTLYHLCDVRRLWHEPDEYGNKLPNGLVIVSGAARGADTIANDWAVVNWVPFEEYPAEWKKHGKAAGFIRNKQMLDTGIDLVIAFPGGNGTKNMVNISKGAHVEVWEIPE